MGALAASLQAVNDVLTKPKIRVVMSCITTKIRLDLKSFRLG